jgi:hypothetical protein
MSLEPSSHLPGGFQIRHRTLGIFQGSAIELAFWHPSSGMPEYGLCRFATREKAEAYVAYLSSPTCPEPLDLADLTIEAYDLTEHEQLLNDHPLPSAWESPT